MDTLRGNFADLSETDDLHDYNLIEDETGPEAPPANIGQDERRMQVRAYNHWASLLDGRNYPAIEDLEPETLDDFGPYSVLLDFTGGIENPGISYLGAKLAVECDADTDIHSLSDVPARSLLSRITDHYMQILANQAPIGFEAEFVNQRGVTILYRGILLPYSSDDDTIDFIYGVINWKEMADQKATDELLLEIDQALDDGPDDEMAEEQDEDTAIEAKEPMEDWADGPASDGGSLDVSDYSEAASYYDDELSAEGDSVNAVNDDYAEDESYEEPEDDDSSGMASLLRLRNIVPSYDDEDDDDYLPKPSFGFNDASRKEGSGKTPIIFRTDDEDDEAPQSIFGSYGQDHPHSADSEHDGFSQLADDHAFDETAAQNNAYADYEPSPYMPQPEEEPEEPEETVEAAGYGLADGPVELDEGEMGLGDWLAEARQLADTAKSSEDRTRTTLYSAIGKAYDFSLAAAENPQEFNELLVDSGLTVQERAPMTPVVKLVFGADYDKTRLTEYATALTHAHRLGVERGALGNFLRQAEGGLKGVVQAERRLRKEEAGKTVEPTDRIREALARKLRRIPPMQIDDLDIDGQEFALVMIRRTDDGEILVLGEIADDIVLVEKAARKLLG